MLFWTPAGSSFEIPDGWLSEIGLPAPSPAPAYPHAESPEGFEVLIVPLTVVRPPVRLGDIEWFNRARSLRVLAGFAAGDLIPPVRVVDLPDGAFRYRVRDGLHRYHLSIAFGFTHLPIAIDPWGESWM